MNADKKTVTNMQTEQQTKHIATVSMTLHSVKNWVYRFTDNKFPHSVGDMYVDKKLFKNEPKSIEVTIKLGE